MIRRMAGETRTELVRGFVRSSELIADLDRGIPREKRAREPRQQLVRRVAAALLCEGLDR